MSPGMIAIRYAAGAVVASIANLSVQSGILGVAPPQAALLAAMVGGTATGLVVKYLYDKAFVFRDPIDRAGAEARRFGLYTATGLFTTGIFWGVETVAYATWRTPVAATAGGALGLLIGYALKYALDRKFVFRRASS